jgi:predicted dehydrogenase
MVDGRVNPGTEGGFVKRFPDVPRVSDRDAIFERSDIDLVVIAAIPRDRAALAIEAMRAGKDVMVDKPGCTTMDQLSDAQGRAGGDGAHLVHRFFRAVRGAIGDPRR